MQGLWVISFGKWRDWHGRHGLSQHGLQHSSNVLCSLDSVCLHNVNNSLMVPLGHGMAGHAGPDSMETCGDAGMSHARWTHKSSHMVTVFTGSREFSFYQERQLPEGTKLWRGGEEMMLKYYVS